MYVVSNLFTQNAYMQMLIFFLFLFLIDRNESEVIEDVVESICNMPEKGNLFVADHPVGVKSRVQELTQFLNNHYSSRSVVLVGILGMGGVVKQPLQKPFTMKLVKILRVEVSLQILGKFGSKIMVKFLHKKDFFLTFMEQQR